MTGNRVSQHALVPMFKGEKYHIWSLKMKTMFKSQECWDLVENGFEDSRPTKPDKRLRENRKKDAKMLFLIQSALEEDILSRILTVETTHEAWKILKEYLGDQKVIMVKLQTLRHKFETLSMGEKETIQEYFAKVSNIVSQIQLYDETLSNDVVVSNVLTSLNSKFEYVVPIIMESHDLSTYTLDEIMSSLMSHENRLRKTVVMYEVNAFRPRPPPAVEVNKVKVYSILALERKALSLLHLLFD